MNKLPVRLSDLAKFIRSKNAGPYRLTFDILFERLEDFERVRKSGAISAERIARAYGIDVDQVSSLFEVEMAQAYKVTLIRQVVQGRFGETDVYGCQQHVPLMNLVVEQ